MNQIMNTKITEQNHELQVSSTEAKFSFFASPISNTKPSSDFTLLDAYTYVTSDKAIRNTMQFRGITDKVSAKDFKAKNFDYVTFGGIFSKRNEKDLITYSGLICFDFDNLESPEQVKNQLLNNAYFDTKLLFLSPSGKGLKWVIENPFSQEKHHDFFTAVSNYLSATYSIEADKSGKDISRACFLPHDADCVFNYVNENKLDFDLNYWLNVDKQEQSILANSVVFPKSSVSSDVGIVKDEIETIVSRVEELSVDIAPSYNDWRDMGFALTDALGEDGRGYYHRLSSFYPNYSFEDTDKQFTACLNSKGSGITISTLFHLAKKSGVSIDNIQFEETEEMSDLVDIKESEEASASFPTFSHKIKDILPDFFHDVVENARSDEEADIMILGSLTALSSCLPNVYGVYDGSIVYPNLFTFVVAPASSGKGRINKCRHLVNPIHEDLKNKWARGIQEFIIQTEEAVKRGEELKAPPVRTLFIPANNSSTSVYQLLSENNGTGLIFETEGDTLSAALRTDFGNFSDGLRKAFHHEPISYSRRANNEFVEIDTPRLSVLLSGTPAQVKILIPDAENGLFSRFIFYKMNFTLEWRDVFAYKNESVDILFNDLGTRFFGLYKFLKAQNPIHFVLDDKQAKAFNVFFNDVQTEYAELLGTDIVASVRRLGLICFRIAMILSVLRNGENEVSDNTLVCDEYDFYAAMTMAKILLSHTASVYKTLMPKKIVPFHSQIIKRFFDSLPESFSRQDFIKVADGLSIMPKTAEKYIKKCLIMNILERESQGMYKKTG